MGEVSCLSMTSQSSPRFKDLSVYLKELPLGFSCCFCQKTFPKEDVEVATAHVKRDHPDFVSRQIPHKREIQIPQKKQSIRLIRESVIRYAPSTSVLEELVPVTLSAMKAVDRTIEFRVPKLPARFRQKQSAPPTPKKSREDARERSFKNLPFQQNLSDLMAAGDSLSFAKSLQEGINQPGESALRPEEKNLNLQSLPSVIQPISTSTTSQDRTTLSPFSILNLLASSSGPSLPSPDPVIPSPDLSFLNFLALASFPSKSLPLPPSVPYPPYSSLRKLSAFTRLKEGKTKPPRVAKTPKRQKKSKKENYSNRTPHFCGKCRTHGEANSNRQKHSCPFSGCDCEGCLAVDKERNRAKERMKRKRFQIKEKRIAKLVEEEELLIDDFFPEDFSPIYS